MAFVDFSEIRKALASAQWWKVSLSPRSTLIVLTMLQDRTQDVHSRLESPENIFCDGIKQHDNQLCFDIILWGCRFDTFTGHLEHDEMFFSWKTWPDLKLVDSVWPLWKKSNSKEIQTKKEENPTSVETSDLRECWMYIDEIQACLPADKEQLNDVDKSVLSIQWPFSELQI